MNISDLVLNNAYENNKTGKYYHFRGIVLNATNANDGQTMVLYSRGDKLFVRERIEFLQKFSVIKENKSNEN